MFHSAFYRSVSASGLVSDSDLNAVAQFLTARKTGTAGSFDTIRYDISAAQPLSRAAVQHLPKLRKNFVRTAGVRMLLSDSAAGADEPLKAGENCSPDDLLLAEELIRQGYINRWQSEQLLEGRVKFTLGRYRIFDSVGRGGYGFVFLGRESAEKPFTAIKVLPISMATPQLSQRFLREIALQKGLLHPNLVRFIESGQDGSVQYMVHEFADGGDLRTLLRRESFLPVPAAAAVAAQAARGLGYLHKNGIVHRDIKPANILLSGSGTAKLIDFGLAVPMTASAEDGKRETAGGDRIAGTVDYMAPDQLRHPSCPVPAWDIYSLGCTLYQMLTGTVPFPDGDPQEKFRLRLQSEPKDVRLFNQRVPFDIADLLKSVLSGKPGSRAVSAEEMANRLDAWVPPDGFLRDLDFGTSVN
ncbi:MAG: serine/threonine protein kinase [Planctomycetaceae bacterium]|nr:serine/threonine protein kinase [Planctomycetaceae bacterium]